MTTYRWTPGAHIKADAQPIGEQLQALQALNGDRLTPRVVVDAARPADSPLHACFEWDTVRAAELFREDQARTVLRSIRIVVTEGQTSTIRRVFVNVEELIDGEPQHGYINIDRALASPDLRQQLITSARRDLIAFKSRYAEFEELAALINPALDGLDSLQLQLTAAPAPVESGTAA